MVNGFVHVIMYLYYALAACGPKVQKYLGWKRYLTILQMVCVQNSYILKLLESIWVLIESWRLVIMLSFLMFFQAQFVSALVLGIKALIHGCDFPLWMQYALVVYMSSFLVLFGNYYRNAYLQQKHQQKMVFPNCQVQFAIILVADHFMFCFLSFRYRREDELYDLKTDVTSTFLIRLLTNQFLKSTTNSFLFVCGNFLHRINSFVNGEGSGSFIL